MTDGTNPVFLGTIADVLVGMAALAVGQSRRAALGQSHPTA